VTDTYRINEPTVIHQTIGGETVIIHLTSGLYYSLEGSGADIWERLSRGETPATVTAELATPAPADRDVIAEEIDAFVRRLVEEDLLVPAPGSTPPTDAQAAPAPGVFRTPRVARYDDLQDLLLLDPIHATDETGWPDRAPAAVGTDRT
jgi:Coenzyme PQQ synthesis protein D (PqqD)